MLFTSRALAFSALMAMANAQIILLEAKGTSGTSLPLQLNNKDAKDAQIINDAEIKQNIVNECGRTLLAGNIDVGQNTENLLADGQITKVTKGSKVEATFKQVSDGGAISCDMDQSSNANGVSGQTKLKVQQAAAQGGNVKLTITMPADMKLIGGSTGDIGTIRCRNAQNFGSCFPVQQTDVTPNQNRPDNIVTTDTLEGVLNKVAINVKDFPDVAAASARAKTEEEQGTNVIDVLIKNNPDIKTGANNSTAGAGGAGKGTGNTAGKGNGAKKGNNGNNRANRKNNAGKNNAAKNNAAKRNGNGNNAAARQGAAAGGRNNANNNAANRNAANRNQKRELQHNRRAVAEVAMAWAKKVLAEEEEY